MTREQLEHILRAASAITGADRLVIIGSQAILGQYPDAPRELLASMEVDVFSLRAADDTDLIDGSIGEESPFHHTFGYYAHGVGIETAVLPTGWQDRLIAVQSESTGDAIGMCLEVHDLAVSKLAAGRPKDLDFVAGLFRHRLAAADTVKERLADTEMSDEIRNLCLGRLTRASN